MGKKITIDSASLMNKIFEHIEAQKIFSIPEEKLEILIHPESLVHAIIRFRNGLTKFLYHETSMIIPLANAIFDSKININDFYRKRNLESNKNIKNLTFKKINPRIFPTIKFKKIANKHQSSPIIINAANEILVDQFLSKNLPFLSIYKTIMAVMNDRNYNKYAIRKPNKISQIMKIDDWARKTTMKKI